MEDLTLNDERETLIVNFNYTDSVSHVLEKLKIKNPIHHHDIEHRVNVIHIHGRFIDKNVVFGVQDDIDLHDEHTFLRKGVSSHLWDDMLVSDLMRITKEKIHIYGHSLGASDHTQFKGYFSDFSGEKIDKTDLVVHYFKDNKEDINNFYSLFREIDALTDNQLSKFRASNNFKMVPIKDHI